MKWIHIINKVILSFPYLFQRCRINWFKTFFFFWVKSQFSDFFVSASICINRIAKICLQRHCAQTLVIQAIRWAGLRAALSGLAWWVLSLTCDAKLKISYECVILHVQRAVTNQKNTKTKMQNGNNNKTFVLFWIYLCLWTHIHSQYILSKLFVKPF